MKRFPALLATAFIMAGCTESNPVDPVTIDDAAFGMGGGVTTANGWYEGEEIYYILGGLEKVSQRGANEIYFIGNDRLLQANVVLHIPGEPGYSPHWNVNLVHTAPGVTVQDILDAGFGSALFNTEHVLFDDVEDILGAESAGLVTLERPGAVVLCPIISEEAAEAPGNTELPESFPPIPTDATF
jgi:hypothetical protein